MSGTWDEELQQLHDSGDVYAYGFGVAHAMIRNCAAGRYDTSVLLKRFVEFHGELQARVDELHVQAQQRLADAVERSNGVVRPLIQPSTTAAIYESENDGDQSKD